MNTTVNKTESKTIVMSYDNFESAIVSFLYATKTIPEDWDVISTDFGLTLNEDGLIEFDLELTKPVKRLKLVNDFSREQLDMFNAFDTLEVTK